MPRYTTFEAFQEAAANEENGYLTGCLRASENAIMSARYNFTYGDFIYSVAGNRVTENAARDLFNLEMRVHGWVSTERHR